MNTNHPSPGARFARILSLGALALRLTLSLHAAPLGTALTYQGRLQDGTNAATGLYDLRFALYDAASGPAQVGATVAKSATGVTNGLFTVLLDFGAVFGSEARWLETAVRTNGAASFATLAPRQPLTPTPAATYASAAGTAATAITASTATNATTATIANGVAAGQVVKSLNTLKDSVTLAPGSNLTLTPSGQTLTLASPTDWHVGGNSGTTPGTDFIGTLDNQPLVFKANGVRVLRLEPTAAPGGGVNVVGGYFGNTANGTEGVTIAGGGSSGAVNAVSASYGTIGGGMANGIGSNAPGSVIAGGQGNGVGSDSALASIGGGAGNMIRTNAPGATIGGGASNLVDTSSAASVIGGGLRNQILSSGPGYGAPHAFIGAGGDNTIGFLSSAASIVGGYGNKIGFQSDQASIGGGSYNEIQANAARSVIAGGEQNSISMYSYDAMIPGGFSNRVTGSYSLAAGRRASAMHQGTFVWADPRDAEFASTSSNQFLIRASGGVGIGTNNPQAALHVTGAVLAGNFLGSGAGLTTLSGAALADGSVTASKFAPGALNHLDAPDGAPLSAVQVGTNGLVGIGTTTPQAGLDLQTSGSLLAPKVLFEVCLFSTDTYTNIGSIRSVSAAGNLVALGGASGSGGVTLVDVSIPEVPVILWQVRDGSGVFTNLGEVGAVALTSNLLAIASWSDDALTLVDVSNPASPAKVAELRNGVGGWNDLALEEDVVIRGNLLAVASRWGNAVTLADISTPANPIQRYVIKGGVGNFTNVNGPTALAIAGNLLAIGSWSNSAVTLVDVSNPANPLKRADLVNGAGGFLSLSNVQGVALSGHLLAIAAASDNAVTLVDVSNPTAPLLRSVIRNGADGVTTLGQPGGLAFSSNRLAVAGFAARAVTLFDVSDPAHPQVLAAVRHGIAGADYLVGAQDVAFVGTNLAVGAYYSSAFTMVGFQPEPAGLFSTGWVGIGTRAPLASLHVAGDVLVEQAQFFDVNADRISLGQENVTIGSGAVAIGGANTARGRASLALGSSCKAEGSDAMAIGYGAKALSSASLAIGWNSRAYKPTALALGDSALADGIDAVAIGTGATALGARSLALGASATATMDSATSLGYNNQATNLCSLALGRSTLSGGYSSTAMGHLTEATGHFSTALGFQSTARGIYSMATGNRAMASNDGAFVWADSQDTNFVSTARDQFLIRARGGLGLNTNRPQSALHVVGTVTADDFRGDGSKLAGVANLSSNQTFTGNVNFTSPAGVGIGTSTPQGALLDIEGAVRINDHDLFLRGGLDVNHGLGWYGEGKPFAGVNLDGPVLYGYDGGGLGTTGGGATNLALSWTTGGRVGIGGVPQDVRLDVQGDIRLNWNDLFLGQAQDRFHGLGWYGEGKRFAEVNVDGPVLYGYSGGGLGTTGRGATNLALSWTTDGNVCLDPVGANTGTLLPGLTFGWSGGSGEGLSSKRSPGGNQYGLDFYTLSQPRLSITQNGNVGLGTTTPAYPLTLRGSGDLVSWRNGATELGRLGVSSSDTNSGWLGLKNASGSYAVSVDTAGNTFFNGGNVGIGTAAPSTALEVAGTVKATAFQGAGTFAWQVASAPAVSALPNRGYQAISDSTVVVTLPTALAAGDIVRVSGPGGGGWKVAQNAGQSILTRNLGGLPGVVWTPRDSNRHWRTVASSADGTKLVAAEWAGPLYTSTDSGQTWTPREIARKWACVASSADGTHLVAVDYGTQIHTSADSGQTWLFRASAVGYLNWVAVACSADGTRLVAAVENGQIFTSPDSGVTWIPQASAGTRLWKALASSADGTKLVAVESGGWIYISFDSGSTWTSRDANRSWSSVASSEDGTKLVAGVNTGLIYTSTDSGQTWIPRAFSANWTGVAASRDGVNLVATAANGKIYTSTDSGVTWIPAGANRTWWAVASSRDGMKLVALVEGGQIYTSVPSTTPGAAGSLVGGQDTALELQFVGSGQFIPLSHEGTITAY